MSTTLESTEIKYHKIVKDQKELEKFIDFLPDLEDEENYYIHLQARRKYYKSETLKGDLMLERFCCSKKNMLVKILRLNAPYGYYTDHENVPLPDEALALYITINPRNLRKAALGIIHELADSIANVKDVINPLKVCHTSIHRAKGKTRYVIFDIDFEEDEDPKEVLSETTKILTQTVGAQNYKIVQTKGGCHVLLPPEKIDKVKNWYQYLNSMLMPDQTGDILTPVPGCNQGGFTPKLYRNPDLIEPQEQILLNKHLSLGCYYLRYKEFFTQDMRNIIENINDNGIQQILISEFEEANPQYEHITHLPDALEDLVEYRTFKK